MAGMVARDLECFLCRKEFTAVYGDFIFAPEIICDDCLAELGQLEDDALKLRVTGLLAQRNIADPALAEHIMQNIRRPRPAPFPPLWT